MAPGDTGSDAETLTRTRTPTPTPTLSPSPKPDLLAAQEDVETHGAALVQDVDPTRAASGFALAGGRIAQAHRPG